MTGLRRAAVVAVVVLASTGLVGCRSSSPRTAGRLTVDAGQAEVAAPGQEPREVTGARDLRVGDRVRVRQGTAHIRLAGGRTVELRLGADLELASGGGGGAPAKPVLMAGDFLATSGDVPFVLGSTAADVTVTGASRISRGVSLLVASYQGSAVVSSGASSLKVPALRQAAVPAAGAFPARPSPLEASPTDPWDQRFLSDAIELGNQLNARSQGFSAQAAGADGRTAAYFRGLLPRLASEPAFDDSLVSPSRPPGETLVGASITLEGTRGTFAERWAAVFGFHDDGATWGLVALDQGVSRVPLLATLEGAIAHSPATFAVGTPSSGPSSLPSPSGSASPAPPAPVTTTTVPRNRPAGSATTTTTRPPSSTTTSVPLAPLNTGNPVIDDTVNSLVNTLSGLLRSLGQ
jgi:hypothetical protein